MSSSSKQLATLEEHLNTCPPNPNPPNTQQRIPDEDVMPIHWNILSLEISILIHIDAILESFRKLSCKK